MTQIPKFVYALMIFFSLFFVVANGGKSFFFTLFSIFQYHTIFIPMTKNNLFLFDNVGSFFCKRGGDCPKQLCFETQKSECIAFRCECV
jgi:hypothetical protein